MVLSSGSFEFVKLALFIITPFIEVMPPDKSLPEQIYFR